jgi:hypothetical protein
MKRGALVLVLVLLLGCSPATTATRPVPAATRHPPSVSPPTQPAGVAPSPAESLLPPTQPAGVSPSPAGSLLPPAYLLDGFEFDGPLDEAALTPPRQASPAEHPFEGRLELLGEVEGGHIRLLRGELGPEYAYLPEFDFELVQSDGYLVPVRRGLVIAGHPAWNLILEPGRAWQDPGDGDYSRASLPFALVVKGGNATFNGTLTFLFDGQRVSRAWYQVTQETTSYTRADLWGLLEAVYHPGPVAGAQEVRSGFASELAARPSWPRASLSSRSSPWRTTIPGSIPPPSGEA